mmetsp:Transcript_36195/g.81341  ORF Transcript_36195/g.81341 Transcript_36195/m.81341 type:complete len:103 (-) Transcript_36195:202-510(-)
MSFSSRRKRGQNTNASASNPVPSVPAASDDKHEVGSPVRRSPKRKKNRVGSPGGRCAQTNSTETGATTAAAPVTIEGKHKPGKQRKSKNDGTGRAKKEECGI